MPTQDLLRETKIQLHRILIAASEGNFTVRELTREYEQLLGHPVPYARLGFKSLFNFFRDIPDVLKVDGDHLDAVVTAVNTEIEQAGLDILVTRPTSMCKPPNMRVPKCLCVSGHVAIGPRCIKRIVPPRPLWRSVSPALNSNCDEQFISRINPPQPFEDFNKNISQDSCLVVKASAHHVDDNHAISKDNIPKIPVISSTRIEDPTSRESDYEKNEIPTVTQRMLRRHINNDVKANLKQLIKEFPRGIRIRNLARRYEMRWGNSLKYTEMGFKTVLQFCTALEDIFRLQQVSIGKSEDLMLFDVMEEVPPHVIQKGIKTEKEPKVLKSVALQTETELSISVDSINEYHILMGFVGEIESLWVSTQFEAGSILTIVITDVYDPVTFWFTIFDEEHFDKMHLLMDDMGLFYEETQMKYYIPKHRITNNMLCAVYYNERWQRIMTISDVEKDKLKVLFIDYGAIEIVDVTDMRYLPQCFRTLPKQAIRGRMDFITPPYDEKFWTIELTKEFIRRVQEKNIIAKITRVDEEDNVLWIEGRIENDEEDISINERFAKNGLAQYCVSYWNNNITEPKNLDYLLPSFHQLETCVATSFMELTLLPRDDVCDIMAENIEKYKALDNGSTSNINDVVENEPNPTQETEFERETVKSLLGDLVRVYVISERELHCFVYKSALHVMTEEFLSKFIPIYSIYGLKVKLQEQGEMICLHEYLSLKDDENLFRALQRCDAGVAITESTVIHLTPLIALDVILFTMKMESLAVLRDVKAIVKEVFG